MHLKTSRGVDIVVEERPLAAPGGQGSVHRILAPDRYQDRCVKLYHPTQKLKLLERRIGFMTTHPPRIVEGHRFRICWPEEAVNDNGRFVGFMMKLAYPGSEQLYTLCNGALKAGSPDGWAATFDRTSRSGIRNRLKLLVNVSIPIHIVHSMGAYVIGDLKPQNILVTLDGSVSIIDVDSMQIRRRGAILFPAGATTPEYVPPEGAAGWDESQGVHEGWDRFAFGVIAYQILFGVHPYTGTPSGPFANANLLSDRIRHGLCHIGPGARHVRNLPAPHQNYARLPPGLKQLFEDTFNLGHALPRKRPTLEAWGHTLSKYVGPVSSRKPWGIRIQVSGFAHSLAARIRTFQDRVFRCGVNIVAEAVDRLIRQPVLNAVQRILRAALISRRLARTVARAVTGFPRAATCWLWSSLVLVPIRTVVHILTLGRWTPFRGKPYRRSNDYVRRLRTDWDNVWP